jgi:carboxyl-terminal processing protease
MRSKRFIWIGMGVLLLVAVAYKPTERYFEIARSLDIYATLFKEVNAHYVDEVDPEKLVHESIDGMLQTLDPYTDYIPEEDLENFRITTTGQYAGIGALIGVVNEKTVVTKPYKNFPAFRAGIQVGDELVEVDGKNVERKPTSEVSTLLKGPARTDVQVKVRRGDQILSFTIRREKINLSNIAYAGIISPGVGYIKLDDFTPGAAKEVEEALSELKTQGAQKLIIDLRDNPGGLMHEAINIVNLFVPKGKAVVSTKGKVKEWNKTYTTLNTPVDTEIPLVVLTGEGSASASEIVAGALQDYDRAVLIGRKTFGKGLVQTTRPLPYNGQLKVTTARYYIPSGRCIQALDYAHRNADGSVDKIADSLKREFKTAAGRSVYDGAGLDPDILIDARYLGTVTAALINAGLTFDYASSYTARHPRKESMKNFVLSDAEYDQFVAWIKSQKFSYVTPLEGQIRQLTEAAKEERYYKDMESQLTLLKSNIEKNKANDLVRFKDEIKEILTQQIAFHYRLDEGQVEVSLSHDPAVQKAVAVLSDAAAMKKILSRP